MLGGFRSPGTQSGRVKREGGMDDSRGTMQIKWSERRGRCKKRKMEEEKKARNTIRRSCSIRVRDVESVK